MVATIKREHAKGNTRRSSRSHCAYTAPKIVPARTPADTEQKSIGHAAWDLRAIRRITLLRTWTRYAPHQMVGLSTSSARHHLCKGQYILDYVCNALNLLEKDYFGLRYVDSHKQRHWLDLTKPVIKQVKAWGNNDAISCFLSFYEWRPVSQLLGYQMFLQLRRDLLHGRLYCPPNDSALLAALVIQSELGDYDSEEHGDNYVSEFKLLLKQTPRLEEKIAEIHQTQLRGQVPAVAEANFLRKACLLDTYGVDPHPVKDHKGNQLYLGINHAGILTFQGSRKTHHFKWQLQPHFVSFNLLATTTTSAMWWLPVIVSCPLVEAGRVEREVMDDMRNIRRDPPQFQRTLTRPPSFRHKPTASPTEATASPRTPARLLSEDSPLRDSAGPVTTSQQPTTTQQPPPESGDGFPVDEQPKRLGASLELLDSGDSGEENGSSALPRPPNHDLHVDLTPTRNPPATDEEDGTSPETPCSASDLAFDPHPTPEYEPECESQEPAFATTTAQPSPRIAFVVWLGVPLLLLLLLLVVLMEWQWAPLADIQRLPELVMLRRQYYEPTRDALGGWFSAFFGPR
ncbi:hypothetical protein HPB48_001910 [Haemaphysalis longicornis]|uniref:FERM domain-containing protein n=1 Tax=Haemaphysalis longicornis TaxID=44386 RepID=A0A9J6G5R7_HAELO|nr:hypothetical protein HPB48_001910 [Haemaphysalis longicornis]